MPDSLNLNTTPLFINASDDAEVDISNGGPGTVYYKTTNTVSSSSNDGSIAAGATLRIRTPRWIVSTTQTKVFTRDIPHREDTINVHGISDTSAIADPSAAIAALEADIAIIGEVLELDTTYTTDEATTIQTAVDNLASQGGGRLLLPSSNPGASGKIKIGSLIEVPQYVNVQGQGKYETELRCSAAAAGILFVGVGDSPSGSRGGKNGGFHINGNQTASTCITVHSVNRMFEDIRFSSPKAAGGVGMSIVGAQNCGFFNCEGEDAFHTGASSVRGVVFDGGCAGINFWNTSLNEFTDGHVVFDATQTPSGMSIPHATNICWYGNLIERTDTGDPIIQIKAGADIHFHGGNISTGSGFTPAAEYDAISITNDAYYAFAAGNGGSSPTHSISFADITFWCAMGAASTKYANVFRCSSDTGNWRKCLDIAPSCGYTNAKYLARLDSVNTVVRAPNPFDGAGGGLSAGFSNPAGSGKINTRISPSAGTFPTRSTVDYYEVTGTTNINNLSATYEGHRVTLKFGGSLTVSASAGNIKLSGGSDMSATADDLLCLVCDGTNWHETSRVVK